MSCSASVHAVRLVQRPRGSPRRAASRSSSSSPSAPKRHECGSRQAGRSQRCSSMAVSRRSTATCWTKRTRRSGVAVFVVADPRVMRDWDALGATAVLPRDFSVEDLITALDGMTKAIPRSVAGATPAASTVPAWAGDLVAVTGARGRRRVHIAAAVAQGFAAAHRRPGATLLADFALDADQGILHHAPDLVPGLPELVDAHRGGSLARRPSHSMVFDVEERDYHLLLGCAAAEDGRPSGHGRSTRPSTRCSRPTRSSSGTSIPTSTATTSAARSKSRTERDRAHRARAGPRHRRRRLGHDRRAAQPRPGPARRPEHGVDPAGSSRSSIMRRGPSRPRSDRSGAPSLAHAGPRLAGRRAPLFVVTRRAIEDAVRAGRPLPSPLVTPTTRAVSTAMTRELAFDELDDERPERVAPGSLGRWTEPEADAV